MDVFGKDRLKQKEQVMEQYIVRLYRGLGTMLAGRLVNTKITPNQITITGLIFVIVAGLFFVTGEYLNLIIGSAILFFSLVLDFTDGTLARMRNQASMFGDWLDAIIDEFREVIVIASLCAGLYKTIPSVSVWILGLVALTTDRLIFRTTNKLYKLLPYREDEINKQVQKTFANRAFLRIGKEFLSVRLLKYTVLPVFIIFKGLYVYLVFAAVYGVILCLAFLAFSVFRIKKEEGKSR